MKSPGIICPVRRNCDLTPRGIAIRTDDIELTWREFECLIRKQAAILRENAVGSGDRVAILADNSIDFATLVFAALRSGLVLVPLNLRLGETHWLDCCEICRPVLLLVDEPRMEFARRSHLPWLPLQGEREPSAADEPAGGAELLAMATDSAADIRLDDDAFIFFTSGSTGPPRGVVHSFGNHYFNALASNRNLPLAPGDGWLVSLPLYHVGGIAILLRCALSGALSYLRNGFDPEAVLRLSRRGELTHLSCVPTMLLDLLNEADDRATDLALKGILLGGAPAGRSLLERCRQRDLPVLPTYGMTEAASQIATLAPGSPADKLHTVGKALAHTELLIADQTDRALPAGEAGEILIRGKTICRGYVGGEETHGFTRDGWLRTGDLGRLDGDGYLQVLGRRDEMFISGGENIHPAEIEAAAMAHETVAECVVLPVPDPRWGERPKLFVLADRSKEFLAEELESHLRSHLARIMWPESIVEIESFPRLATGKIDRKALRREHLDT